MICAIFHSCYLSESKFWTKRGLLVAIQLKTSEERKNYKHSSWKHEKKLLYIFPVRFIVTHQQLNRFPRQSDRNIADAVTGIFILSFLTNSTPFPDAFRFYFVNKVSVNRKKYFVSHKRLISFSVFRRCAEAGSRRPGSTSESNPVVGVISLELTCNSQYRVLFHQ